MRHRLVTVRQDLRQLTDGYGIWLTTLVCSCGAQVSTEEEFREHQSKATGKEMADAILSALKIELKDSADEV
jgi:hypothetical protein